MVMHLPYMRKVPGLNPVQDTKYPEVYRGPSKAVSINSGILIKLYQDCII